MIIINMFMFFFYVSSPTKPEKKAVFATPQVTTLEFGGDCAAGLAAREPSGRLEVAEALQVEVRPWLKMVVSKKIMFI